MNTAVISDMSFKNIFYSKCPLSETFKIVHGQRACFSLLYHFSFGRRNFFALIFF